MSDSAKFTIKVHIAGLQGSQGGLGIRHELDVDLIELGVDADEVGVGDQGHVIACHPFLDGERATGPGRLVDLRILLQAGLALKI